MRLTQEEIKKIKEVIFKIFGKSRIYVFGSRTDDKAKGGDIDIFVIPENRENLFKKKFFFLEKNIFQDAEFVPYW